MAAVTFNVSSIEMRMLNDVEAASYCGLPAKHFKICCDVRPVNIGGKALLWDKRDLDQWIETEKIGEADTSREAILAQL